MTAHEVFKKPCVVNFDPRHLESAEGRSLFYRACDLKSRFFLNRLAIEEAESGDLRVVAMLVHAESYLSDRLAYELGPPPSKTAIPINRVPEVIP